LPTNDVELIATTIEDRMLEGWENVEKHKASILEIIQEVKNALEQLRIREEHSSKEKPTKNKEGLHVGETMQIAAQGSTNLIINLDMLFIDEEVSQRTLKEIETLDLAFPKILTKALYKLKIIVA
jgi:hypothetical protein